VSFCRFHQFDERAVARIATRQADRRASARAGLGRGLGPAGRRVRLRREVSRARVDRLGGADRSRRGASVLVAHLVEEMSCVAVDVAAWPMCLGPLAYGRASAVRT
jgi:hypothetical protein